MRTQELRSESVDLRVGGVCEKHTHQLVMIVNAYNLSIWEVEEQDQEFKASPSYVIPCLRKSIQIRTTKNPTNEFYHRGY